MSKYAKSSKTTEEKQSMKRETEIDEDDCIVGMTTGKRGSANGERWRDKRMTLMAHPAFPKNMN